MNYIFYHGSDFDGMCSGVILKRAMPDAQVSPWEYNYAFPDTIKFTFDDTVYFADVTTNPYDRILELTKITNVVVIDHHKTFIDWARATVSEEIREHWVLNTSKSGCMLSWEYAFPDKPMPKTVWLLGNYDIWNNKNQDEWNNVILPFQFGMRGTKFEDPVWNELMVPEWEGSWIPSIIERGHILLEYINSSNKSMVKKHAFEATFEGHPVIACNTHNFSSQTFDALWDENKYDFMIAFTHSRGKEYWVSMYTTKPGINVSEIALKYGGGGHPQAAGCTVKQLSVVDNVISISKE